jgi:hypothetical protein
MTDVRDELAQYCAALDATQPRVDREAIASGESRGAHERRRGVTVAVVVLLVGIGIGIASAAILSSRHGSVDVQVSPGTWQVRSVVAEAPLSGVPMGVSTLDFGSTPTFVVRTADSVRVFLTNVQHLSGEDGLWWCPHEKVFAAPTHGEVFGPGGEALGGPAQRGLNELAVDVSGGEVTARIDQVRLGKSRDPNRDYRTGDGAWDVGRGSFCADAIKLNRPSTSPPLSRADAIQVVSRLSNEIEAGATYAAKLTTNAANSAAHLPQESRLSDPQPQGLVWLVAVHGRLHPEFALNKATKAWGVFTVDATTGSISEVAMANTLPSLWSKQPDLAG